MAEQAQEMVVDATPKTTAFMNKRSTHEERIKKDEIILLSPGCASQDIFMNYQDRGNQFVELCKKIF